LNDPFYENAVRPYTWFAAVLLFLSYVIGLLFTLRTHAATIWNSELEEKRERLEATVSHNTMNTSGALVSKTAGVDYGSMMLTRQNTTTTLPRSDIRETQLYKRILGQSLKQVGFPSPEYPGIMKKSLPDDTADMTKGASTNGNADAMDSTTQIQKPRALSIHVTGLSEQDSESLVRQMAEMAATAATVAARDATSAPHTANRMARTTSTQYPPADHQHAITPTTTREQHHPQSRTDMTASVATFPDVEEAVTTGAVAGGHDAPNWSRTKSYVVLLSATLAYAVIAEILVSTVDAVLENVDIDEKFLGITLFALVPNTTEFLNAISFAMNGNIALSMEIGSAYALQVCLLQIPALVLFSALEVGGWIGDGTGATFTLLFPQWDMVTVILCVFLLSYMYGEGKSNYFKGSIFILSYLVVVVGFYYAGFSNAQSGGGLLLLADQTGGGVQYVDVASGRRVVMREF